MEAKPCGAEEKGGRFATQSSTVPENQSAVFGAGGCKANSNFDGKTGQRCKSGRLGYAVAGMQVVVASLDSSDILHRISSALTSPRTVAPAQKIWASTTPSKQQLNPSLTQVPGNLQEEAREEVRPGLRKHARELLDRDKKKDELDLSFEVEKSSFFVQFRFGRGPLLHT